MKTITEQEAIGESVLNEVVAKDSELKTLIVDYVGNNTKELIGNDQITVEMIVAVMADEFPEFLLAVAEENWIRGYQQAINDVEAGEKLVNDALNNLEAPPEAEETDEQTEGN